MLALQMYYFYSFHECLDFVLFWFFCCVFLASSFVVFLLGAFLYSFVFACFGQSSESRIDFFNLVKWKYEYAK